jgi:hypothetical protein
MKRNSSPASRKLCRILRYMLTNARPESVRDVIDIAEACLIVSKLRDEFLGWR